PRIQLFRFVQSDGADAIGDFGQNRICHTGAPSCCVADIIYKWGTDRCDLSTALSHRQQLPNVSPCSCFHDERGSSEICERHALECENSALFVVLPSQRRNGDHVQQIGGIRTLRGELSVAL